jgi:hypothetical protein
VTPIGETASSPADGRRIAEKVLASLPVCPLPEIGWLGKTLMQWRDAFLAYFDTYPANNGDTEAIHGLIEFHRSVAQRLPQPRPLPTTQVADRRRTRSPHLR